MLDRCLLWRPSTMMMGCLFTGLVSWVCCPFFGLSTPSNEPKILRIKIRKTSSHFYLTLLILTLLASEQPKLELWYLWHEMQPVVLSMTCFPNNHICTYISHSQTSNLHSDIIFLIFMTNKVCICISENHRWMGYKKPFVDLWWAHLDPWWCQTMLPPLQIFLRQVVLVYSRWVLSMPAGPVTCALKHLHALSMLS